MAGGYKNIVTYDTFQALIKFSPFLPLLKSAARICGVGKQAGVRWHGDQRT